METFDGKVFESPPVADRKVTLSDVAKALGVHPSTVSRALDPLKRQLIGEEVVRKVEEMAEKLGYQPDPVAVSLRTRKSRLIGALVPDIANPVFSPIIGGLEEELSAHGYSLIISNAPETQRQIGLIQALAARRVDGLVLATAARVDEALEFCISQEIPVVLVNRSESRELAPSVTSDDGKGMRLAVDHLRGLGHRSIGHVAGPGFLSTGHQRRLGFLEAMQAHGMPVPKEHVEEAGAFTRDEGILAARRLLARAPSLTAVAAANDLLALGVYAAARERGLACPQQLSITGHNDMPLVDLVEPPLTTVRISHHEMGRSAAHLLLEIIEHNRPADAGLVLQPILIVRNSTAVPRPQP